MSCSKCSFSPTAKRYVREQLPVITKKEAEARENMMLLGGLLIGITAGIALGAGIAALTTPQSGAEARQKIADKKDSAINEVRERTEKVSGKVKTKAVDVKGKIKDNSIIDKLKERFSKNDEDVVAEYTIRYDEDGNVVEAIESLEEEAEEAMEEAAEAVEDIAEEIEEAAEEIAEDE